MKTIIKKVKPYSSHPDDFYLSIRLAEIPENKCTPFATYLHNSYSDGLFEGHYFKTEAEALEDYDRRGK